MHIEPTDEAGAAFFGSPPLLIGRAEETWDAALLVRHKSVEVFLSFAKNEEYLAGVGHRTAALADSRLLPIVEGQ